MLGVAAAMLLLAGILSAASVDRTTSNGTTVVAGGRATPAGLNQVSLLGEAPAVTVAPATTLTPPTTRSTTRSTTPSTTTTTTTALPAKAATTTVPVRPSVPPGNLAPASSWQAKAEGVSVTLRIEPARPVAGQPIRFSIDAWGVDACCDIALAFDDSTQFQVNLPRRCEDPSPLKPGPLGAVATHTFAKPGAYRLFLQVMDGDVCKLPAIPPDPVPLHNIELEPCIAVGPGDAADAGCPPRPKPF